MTTVVHRMADSSSINKVALSIQPVAEQGGSDNALVRLAGQLVAAGWEVHVALPAPSPIADAFGEAGARLHTIPMLRLSTSHNLAAWLAYALGWPGSVLRLWRLTRRVGADVVHSNSLHSWYGWAAALLAGKPHVWHAREIVTQSVSALRVERFLARHFAHQVLAVSTAVAAQLHPANVEVVHEEADATEFFPGRAGQARPRLGLSDEGPLVGYIGRIDTWKGVDVLLDALASLTPRRPGLQAVVAGGTVRGKEAYAASLAERASELGVRWLGPLPGAEAADLMADLDCLAYPSTGPEPWGLSLVEALACGVPAVTTDAGGPRGILAGLGGSAGILVQPGDAAALASAIDQVLPEATSTQLRRARPVLRSGQAPPYPELFAAAAARRHRRQERKVGPPPGFSSRLG